MPHSAQLGTQLVWVLASLASWATKWLYFLTEPTHPPDQVNIKQGLQVFNLWKVKGWVSGRCLEGVWKISGGCLDGVWKVPGRCLEGAWKVSGRCLEGVLNVSGTLPNLPISTPLILPNMTNLTQP